MTPSGRSLSTYSSYTSTAEPPEAAAFESDFVVILASLLCALICIVGLIAVARCAWLRRGSATAAGGVTPSANRGLKKKVVQSLPKLIFSSAATDGKMLAECAICLAEYGDGDEIRILPQCGHGFHVGCVDTWLGSHSSCPSCRQILVVTRCRKCGDFPAETEMKMRQDGGIAALSASASSADFLP